ncbi:D-3-phosphoglycerate dehydrogenase [Geomicrobium halophilum]|uniref:D-3-phosphoglycerate dehydrogenase n=1 Tax=Geomicrobium halophilum TaxID=549000 RepID=A0A841PXT7_9BACL|nr:phosphoglycerate dehydrogenase [Geomicrobium halophilum]MBB6449002.1 D-3-phosphoglycerate dehydrogenase [Geomicrobium halophilum]
MTIAANVDTAHAVLVADAMSDDGLSPLLNKENFEVVRAKPSERDDLNRFSALLVRSSTQVDAALLAQMPNLKIVARAGVGTDNIDLDAATKHGVIIINAPDGNTISTAEHTFAMMMSLCRNIPQAYSSVKAHEWNRKAFQGTELRGKTLGIVGFGRIGSELAKRAAAFQMPVVVYDPFLTAERAKKVGVTLLSFEELLEAADVITVHTPLTKETKNLFNEENLNKTKPGVFILNCARGGIIDEQALQTAIENGHVAGAALDVFEHEPATNYSLIDLPQVIVTPHIAASTVEAQESVATQVAEEVISVLEGAPAAHSINLPAISEELYEKIRPYYELTNTMGNFVSQCVKTPVQHIDVSFSGSISREDTTVIARSFMAGFLSPRVDAPVNVVNAGVIAEERGISYSQAHNSESYGYANLVQATVHGNAGEFVVQGTYIEAYGPRIVRINEFNVDLFPTGHLIYIRHSDQPGVIGKMGQLLGQHNVNIATMQVGRKEEGGEAIMMLAVDKEISPEVINDLSTFDEILAADMIEL